jgi:hypothetical protein
MMSQLPRTTPEISEAAVRLATICRIVVQNFLPPEHWAEAERRFRLASIAELQQLAARGPLAGQELPDAS